MSPVGKTVVGGLGRSSFPDAAVFAACDFFRVFGITWHRLFLHWNKSGEIIRSLDVERPSLANPVLSKLVGKWIEDKFLEPINVARGEDGIEMVPIPIELAGALPFVPAFV